MDELWDLIRSIPKGKVACYGGLGHHLRPPASGRIVGRLLAQCPHGVPWWRVVSRSGHFPIEKRDPFLGLLQEELLRQEGVDSQEGKVDMKRFGWEELR